MNRNQLINMENCDTAIEVGVWRGDFSVAMINTLKPKKFYAVDPYRLWPGMVSAPGPEFTDQNSLDRLAESVKSRLTPLGGSLIRETSEQASTQFADQSVDVVYIDGDHTYDGVSTDIKCWWPKIKSGGILAGHDYCVGRTGKGYDYGVIPAVKEFADQNGLDITVSTDHPPSWRLDKP